MFLNLFWTTHISALFYRFETNAVSRLLSKLYSHRYTQVNWCLDIFISELKQKKWNDILYIMHYLSSSVRHSQIGVGILYYGCTAMLPEQPSDCMCFWCHHDVVDVLWCHLMYIMLTPVWFELEHAAWWWCIHYWLAFTLLQRCLHIIDLLAFTLFRGALHIIC